MPPPTDIDSWKAGWRAGIQAGIVLGLLIVAAFGSVYLLLYIPWAMSR
jgi:hypothetical protein